MDNLSKKQRLDDDLMVTGSSSSSSASSSNSSIVQIEEINNPMQNASNNLLTVSRAMEINTQNERIRRWQERQLARCIDENTINRVIELYLRVVHEVNSLNEPINIPQLLQSNETAANASNSGLEESAILMAISEHGLQQGIAPPSSINLPLSDILNEPAIAIQQESRDCIDNVEHMQSGEDDENENIEVNESPPDSPVLEDEFNENEEHIDFMEAAVAAAIQKKGLTPFAISMSPTR